MNRTFKVVYNRARSGLMVANEITSSVQKKRGRTVAIVASGLLALFGNAEAVLANHIDVGTSAAIASVSNTENTSEPKNWNDNSWCGGVYLVNNFGKALTLENLVFTNNIFSVASNSTAHANAAYTNGGVFHFYADNEAAASEKVTFKNVQFNGNVVSLGSSLGKTDAWTFGGALTIKGMQVEFKDVAFNNNRVEATVKDENAVIGAAATGGALTLDTTEHGETYKKAADVTFTITKDMAYTGNAVSSVSSNYAKASGGYNTTSGGFMYMDRPSNATFDIQDGATLTLGVAGAANGIDDSIASSIHGATVQGDNVLTKKGEGRFVVNSTLNDYFGKVNVEAGEMTVARDWKIKNAVTVGKEGEAGAKLVLNGIVSFGGFQESAKEKQINETVRETKGSLKVLSGGELVTALGNVFSDGDQNASLASSTVTKKDGFTFEDGSTLTLTDEGVYSFNLLDSLVTAANANEYAEANINLLNASVTFDGATSEVEISSNVATLSISGGEKIGVGKSLTLNGEGQTSSVKELNVWGQGKLLAKNNTTVNVEKLTGNGDIFIGESNESGAKMFVKELAMSGGQILVDPSYGHSILQIDTLGEENTLNTGITAGQGAFVSIGADVETAQSAVAKLNGFESIQSVLYMAKPINVGERSITVTSEPVEMPGDSEDGGEIGLGEDGGDIDLGGGESEVTPTNSGVRVLSGGALVVDQAAVGTNAVFTGTDVQFDGGKLAIVNAAAGTLNLVAELATDNSGSLEGLTAESVLTDNPFISVGDITTTSVVLEASASEEGMTTLASMGIQSMIRRADMVLAETIADRMAGDVETGSNLWVDVRGEHYERSRLDNGAGFKADIGYGAFGAEFAPTDTTTLGAAFQYGNGTVKGDVASVKNKTKDYSFALYGSAMLGDTGVKAVGEVAYTKSTNDITSSLALLNQDTDATMLSAGVKAQKTFDVGTFEVTPSLGVRVSHIKTDAMKAGNVDLEKQKQTIVQIPIALRVNAKATETAGGWSVTPKFKVAYIPTVGDKSIEVFGVKQSVIDTSPVQGSFGVGFAKGNLAIDVAAHLGAGNKGTSAVGGKVGLTYRF